MDLCDHARKSNLGTQDRSSEEHPPSPPNIYAVYAGSQPTGGSLGEPGPGRSGQRGGSSETITSIGG